MSGEGTAGELATRTIQRINSALEKRQVAGVPEVIHLIQELSTKAFSITIKELAEIISQDVAVTAKVISAANTVGYNPTGVPVNTVSQSIQVIGFERVRNLAISLLLVQNAEQTMSVQEQREAASFALSSGLVAQALMEQQGSADPEQAFVCTSLRNYGRLLMTTFLIDEYREALDRASQVGEELAFREIFGLTPLELSYHLLLSSHLPKEILRSLQTLPPGMVQSTALRPEDELLVMADLSVRLCSLATNADLEPEQFKRGAAALCERYGKTFKVDQDGLQDAFQWAAARMNSFSQTYGIRSLSSNTMRFIQARAEDKDVPVELKLAPPVVGVQRRRPRRDGGYGRGDLLAAPTQAAPPLPPPSNTPVRSIALGVPAVETAPQVDPMELLRPACILKGIEEIVVLLGRTPFDLKAVQAVAVRALRDGLALSDVLIFDRTNDSTPYRVADGTGPLYDSVRGRVGLIAAENRDVFGVSLSRREDVLIENGRDPKFAQYIPLWMRLNAPVGSMIILPAFDGERLSGLICGARAAGPPLRFGSQVLQSLRAMRIHLATARRLAGSR